MVYPIPKKMDPKHLQFFKDFHETIVKRTLVVVFLKSKGKLWHDLLLAISGEIISARSRCFKEQEVSLYQPYPVFWYPFQRSGSIVMDLLPYQTSVQFVFCLFSFKQESMPFDFTLDFWYWKQNAQWLLERMERLPFVCKGQDRGFGTRSIFHKG